MKKIFLAAFFTLFGCSSVFAQIDKQLQDDVRSITTEITGDLTDIRHHLHQYPELGNREFKTAALVAEKLKALGLEVRTGVAHTGVIGILNGKKAGRVVAVRADMDALPITEQTGLPFSSKNEGIMHACGHDMHTTIGIGTATALSRLAGKFNGTVKFLFQPAEEGNPEGEEGGADLMIEEGALENPAPEVIFGLHVGIDWDVGQIRYAPRGALAANDQLEIKIIGKGTHAASPWSGIDPVVTASQVVLGLQTIRSRLTDARIPVVVSISMIHGGQAFNVIPDEVVLTGTIRNHDPNMRLRVHKLVRQITNGICESAGAKAEITITPGAPVTYNHPELTEWSAAILKKLFGKDNIGLKMPSMGAEDFAHYSLKIPAFFYILGVRNEAKGYVYPGHNAKFMIDDKAIPVGVQAMTNLVLEYLASSEKFEHDWKK